MKFFYKGISYTVTATYALKYYPSRDHSIGIVRTGVNHYVESLVELPDAFLGLFGTNTKFGTMHKSRLQFF